MHEVDNSRVQGSKKKKFRLPPSRWALGVALVLATGLASVSMSPVFASGDQVGSGDGLLGHYFDGRRTQSGDAWRFNRVDEYVHFEFGPWGPGNGLGNDDFTIRWDGLVEPSHASGTKNYTFFATADDGVRVTVNGERIIDGWRDQGQTEYSGTIALTAGERYDIKIEYYEATLDSFIKVDWQPEGEARTTLPKAFTYSDQ